MNIERTEQALATGASTVAVGCPFCMTMVTDGTKAKGVDDKVKVKDLAELVAVAVKVKARRSRGLRGCEAPPRSKKEEAAQAARGLTKAVIGEPRSTARPFPETS